MRKIFKKVLAGVTSVALVSTLFVGMNFTTDVKAEDTPVTLANWTFVQGGQYNPNEPGNEGYITSATLKDTNETISGYLKTGEASISQEKTAKAPSTGFDLEIANTGWDMDWATGNINPWSIRSEMRNIPIKPGHDYTITFTASASSKKYAAIALGSEYEGEPKITSGDNIIAITQQDQTFTYTFTNWAESSTFNFTMSLGAFGSQKDYAGIDRSDVITETQVSWSGSVYVSNFTITDNGENKDYVPTPIKPSVKPTEKPTVQPTVKPTVKPTTPVVTPKTKKLAKVKKLKAKNIKKRTVKITWKKVSKAKSYQVKVGKKTYTTKKVKLTVKKLKKGKKYTIRVRAKAAGYKTGAWATTKVKIKK